MSDCRFGVSPVNYPDPDPDPTTVDLKLRETQRDNFTQQFESYWYALSFEDFHQWSARLKM